MNDNVMNSIPEMIPIREASARTGLSYECIRKLCLTNKIVYFKSGAKYLINFGKLCDFLNGESVSA